MAGVAAVLTTSGPLSTGTSAKTILRYTAPASNAVIVRGWSIDFAGTSPTADKIPVSLWRGRTGGSSTSRNPAVAGAVNPASVGLGSGAENFTVEGSGGTLVRNHLVHPQSGYNLRNEYILLAPGESIELATSAPAAVNAVGRFELEV